mgnify:FL=1
MYAADDSILEESGSVSEGFGGEPAEEISVVDNGYGEFDDLAPVSFGIRQKGVWIIMYIKMEGFAIHT